MQNTSHAVMAQRSEPQDSLDDFPTPPWATHALIRHVIGHLSSGNSCLEPACNRGLMVDALKQYNNQVTAFDVHDYGCGYDVQDFLTYEPEQKFDWVITNPPYKLAEKFITKALDISDIGVAMLVRTSFAEGVGRYERLFKDNPPAIVAQFVERVPMVKGRYDPKASTATSYAWFVWCHKHKGSPLFEWIPPCRKELEKLSQA